jgi:hypothetical protein
MRYTVLGKLRWLFAMWKHSNWFEKNEPAQARFEENEDWLEELEDRIIELEEHSHPPKDLCEFDSWEEIDNRFKKIERKLKEFESQSTNNS